jgi:high-affinity nickel permease
MARRSDGTTIVALYHIVSGFLSLFTLCLVLSIPLIVGIAVPASNDPNAGTAVVITGIIGLLIGAIFLLIAIANWVIGWGLWERQEWARLGAIVKGQTD